MASRFRAIKKVGITGAAGAIGTALTDGLQEQYDLTLFYLDEKPRGADRHRVLQADLSDAQQTRGLFEGLDAVIHLAAVHRGNPSFTSVLPANIIGTYHVLDEAQRAGVAKVVFGSTNHVQNAYATGTSQDLAALDGEFAASGRRIRLSDPPAPDSFYGVSKLFGEDLGRYYACFLRALQFVAVRIGWVGPEDPSTAPKEKITRTEAVERHYRALFLSRRDLVQLFLKTLQVEAEFLLVYGTSDNPAPLYDLSSTREALGYAPLDSSHAYFEAMLQSHT